MKLTTSFGEYAEFWDVKVAKGIKSTQLSIKGIFDLLGNPAKKSIYEIACGNGVLARLLAEKGAKIVWASDVAKEMIFIAQNKYEANGIKYLVREATNFKRIPRNFFDAVIIHQGIFYVKNVEALIKGVSKLLKPRGVLIFTIQHPLFPEARKAMSQTSGAAKSLADLLQIQEQYLTTYNKVVSKDWDNHKVTYLSYKRPVSYYINLCGKYGLLVEAIQELKSQTKNKGKVFKSNIPSMIVVKAVKAKLPS